MTKRGKLITIILGVLAGIQLVLAAGWFDAGDSGPRLLSLREAEQILGQRAHLSDSSHTAGVVILSWNLVYTADSADEKTGKTGNVYFMYEEYETIEDAQRTYADIKTGNEKHEGFKVLQGMGDEAYFHSDGENFMFILVRKGAKMLRMKVNKVTGKTSPDAFNAVAARIADAI